MKTNRGQRRARGFTLVEIMIVVIILSVLTAMIVPQFASTYQAAVLRGAARELVTAVRLASSEAVTRNQVVRLVIDAQKRRYWMECREEDEGDASRQPSIQDVPGAAGELDEKITIEVRSSGEARPGPAGPGPRRGARTPAREEGIPFRPDGTTEAREIVLRDQEGFGLALRVHPTTARVRTVVLEPELQLSRAAPEAEAIDRRMSP